ncbi:HD domain-containing protein [Candidatus Sumerlaeota bacterium]|nr:HD domain-containing protein [Candidatus Sumerlaeota bacterium]
MKKIVLVQRFEIRASRKGENYGNLAVNLGKDGSYASMPAKIWRIDQWTQSGRALPSQGNIIEADYRQDEYNGAPQWTIENFRLLEGDALAKARELFVQPSKIDKEFYKRKLDELIEQTDAARVSGQVLREVFDQAAFREKFYTAPAAKTRHQNYPGGLLEHTLNVTCVALAIADAYGAPNRPGLNFNMELLPVDRSLLISAGLLHDIGKIDTYQFAPLSETTDANSFEGHLPISYAIARELTRPMKHNPPYDGAGDEVDKLLNCILSHHGSLEFGSPVLPACAEAVILAQADVADARLAELTTEGYQTLRQNPEARWAKNKDFTGGIFIGDWPPPK